MAQDLDHREAVAETDAASGDASAEDGRDHRVYPLEDEHLDRMLVLAKEQFGRRKPMLAAPLDVEDMILEIRRHRAMVTRLEAWADSLEEGVTHASGGGVGRFIAAELRNRMRGVTP